MANQHGVTGELLPIDLTDDPELRQLLNMVDMAKLGETGPALWT